MATRAVGEKRGPKIGDAASLWNFTPSPGWSKAEAHILKLCLMKFGVGKWVQILETGLLPGKLIQQLNGQTQRLLGQQSLAAYTGLQVDIDRVRTDNEAKDDAQRKAGLIINSGPNVTREMKEKMQEEARAKYGLTPDQIREAEEQLEELAASKKADADDSAAAAAAAEAPPLVSPSKMSKDDRVLFLRALHTRLASMQTLLVKHEADPKPAVPVVAAVTATVGRTASGQENQAANAAVAITKHQRAAPKASKQQQAKNKRGGAGKRRAEAPVDHEGDEDVEMCDAAYAQNAADTADIGTLVAMGFGERQARDALEEAGGSVEHAAEWLMVNCV